MVQPYILEQNTCVLYKYIFFEAIHVTPGKFLDAQNYKDWIILLFSLFVLYCTERHRYSND